MRSTVWGDVGTKKSQQSHRMFLSLGLCPKPESMIVVPAEDWIGDREKVVFMTYAASLLPPWFGRASITMVCGSLI
jgi:hypothetical protein